MSYLAELYSELKASKQEIYEKLSCHLNAEKFIKHLESKGLPEEIFNNMHIMFFYHSGGAYYGEINFGFHVNILFYDKKNSNWYVLDYDIKNIKKGYPLDEPLLYSDFMKHAFSIGETKMLISQSINNENCYLGSFQQVMIFKWKEYQTILQQNPDLIKNLQFISMDSEKQEENFLWKLYKDFNISFNNLYELIKFLQEGTPDVESMRIYYQNKAFEEIFVNKFSNSVSRLDEKKLFFLKDFLFNSLINDNDPGFGKSKDEKNLVLSQSNTSSNFFKLSSKKSSEFTEKKQSLSMDLKAM